MTASPLTRSRDERMLAGVCAGLAAHLGMPVGAVRAAMVVFALLGGAGALFYLWLWALVPWDDGDGIAPMRRVLTRPGVAPEARAADVAGERIAQGRIGAAPAGSGSGTSSASPSLSPSSAPPSGQHAGTAPPATSDPGDHRQWPVAELLLGGALLVAGAGLVLVQLGVQLRLDVLLPAMAVLVGVGLTWWQIADRDRPERNQLPRVLGALALVAVGVLMFFVTSRQPSAFTVVAAALAVLAGVALALAPWALRINRDLVAERSARAREAERAEIAAHLHDSVLQTLAAIQQRSEPGSEVARLARGQERDLREWLFRSADGAEPAPREAVEVELRAHAAALEAEHAVRFEVVAVGTGKERSAPEPIVAAAREAMLNAARHAGGDVTVYIEANPRRVSIDVTDRGPGLDTGDLPDGRMGVRESILGRMERAGGTARIAPGPGGAGTAVRLALPLEQEEDAGDE
ncbi:MAG: PspC domain-containing protein [Leucobacter sp.]